MPESENIIGYRVNNQQINKFIEHIERMCKTHNIELYLADSNKVNYASIDCNGYFDPRLNRLAVAMGSKPYVEDKWLKTLTHEYGHMTQWIEKCDAWQQMFFDSDALIDSETIIGLWIEKEIELNDDQLKRHISSARGVEVDCEQRVLKLIDKFNLPIDKEEYAKTANAYAWFWTTIIDTRAWYKIGYEPYNIKAILDLMPSKIYDNDFYDKIAYEIWKAIMDNCYTA